MHQEDVVQTGTGGWSSALAGLLHEEQSLYHELGDSSRALRRALIQGHAAGIGEEVARHQELLARLRALQRRGAELCREAELAPEMETYSLARLAHAPEIEREPALLEQVRAAETGARETARELAHNRQLIARLSDWMAREIRLLLEPLREAGGYGPQGAAPQAAAEPALIDRRG
ncbi:MAG: flagellar export chaperone FlgN [Candidatus Eisenbacteria bacterium]|uniref:Flagellar export chaperone FlgN n=1 Tax=Eiseniibacteriota bacterium TaxID=2212470 RepID=A0A938BQA4_UNCEI|nr:flagellar export chaperone FlgN [Candidatus Eisenbacteria bacterium]